MGRLIVVVFLCFNFIQQTAAEDKITLSIAVNDLSAQGINENEAVIVSEQLRVELMKYPNFRLIERSQMANILKEQGFQQSGCTSDACAVEVGQLLGVQNIAVGSVGRAGSYTVLTVRILDVATGEVVVNKSMQTRGGIDKVLENGIQAVATGLYLEFFPDATIKAEVAKPKNRSIGKTMLVGGGALALIGGGVAAYIFLQKSSTDPVAAETVPENNIRIDLP